MLRKLLGSKKRRSRRRPSAGILGGGSAQAAYQLLQRGVKRREETGQLLGKRELGIVLSHHASLVLSASERALVKDSEQALGVKDDRLKTSLMAAGAMLLFGMALSLFWKYSIREPVGVKEAILVAEAEASIEAPSEGGAMPAVASKTVGAGMPALGGFPIVETGWKKAGPWKATTATDAGPGADLVPATDAVAKPQTGETAMPPPEPAPEQEITAEEKSRFSEIHPVHTREGEVHIVLYNGRWALATPRERFLLLPEYDRIEVYDARRGLFRIEREGKEGMAAADGTIVLHPFYDRVKAYYPTEGLFVVANAGKYGVYDGGREAFAVGLSYRNICCFSEGLFGVQTSDGKWGFVNRSGKEVVAPAFDAIDAGFENGRAAVRQGGEQVTIDSSGKAVVIR